MWVRRWPCGIKDWVTAVLICRLEVPNLFICLSIFSQNYLSLTEHIQGFWCLKSPLLSTSSVSPQSFKSFWPVFLQLHQWEKLQMVKFSLDFSHFKSLKSTPQQSVKLFLCFYKVQQYGKRQDCLHSCTPAATQNWLHGSQSASKLIKSLCVLGNYYKLVNTKTRV